ncbi:hypothetical protein [Pedobacter mucosus]|uniref:hypothetical protein n=1 Tax=Pedobacter mucosus TaxID=2895286 RepID=UPI001EE4C36D|nr:hypothetical protein [Pedobacter mucosus]UKT63757.1 hypothetical protein LOK61_18555 [Pedobacter mucosus]
MNNIFNIQRFGLLLRRQWLEFGKIYLISLVVLLGVLVGFYFFNIPKVDNGIPRFNGKTGFIYLPFRYPIFSITGFLFISIIASSYFSDLGQKPKAIIDLMIPASIFEKFLSGIFYTAICSIAGYLLIFYIVDTAFCNFMEGNFKALSFTVTLPNFGIINRAEAQSFYSEMPFNEFKFLFFAPLLTTSIFLLGSVYFAKFHYIKTALFVVLTTGAIIFICFKFASILSQNMIMVNEGSQLNNKETMMTIMLMITATLTFIIWAITYVRLKEKEV